MSISGSEIETYLLTFWNEQFCRMTPATVLVWRRNKMRDLDGDLLPPIQVWPTYIRRIFFQTAYPLGNLQLFKIYLFFVGNGLDPRIGGEWVLSSIAICTWQRRERILRRRVSQIKWIHDNVRRNQHHWRYYDLMRRMVLYIDGRIFSLNNLRDQ